MQDLLISVFMQPRKNVIVLIENRAECPAPIRRHEPHTCVDPRTRSGIGCLEMIWRITQEPILSVRAALCSYLSSTMIIHRPLADSSAATAPPPPNSRPAGTPSTFTSFPGADALGAAVTFPRPARGGVEDCKQPGKGVILERSVCTDLLFSIYVK